MAASRLAPLRRFTLRLVNPVTRIFAGRVPGFGILTYVGHIRHDLPHADRPLP